MALLAAGCGSSNNTPPTVVPTPTAAPSSTPTATPVRTASPTPTAACASPSASPTATVSAIDFSPQNPVINNPVLPGGTASPAVITVTLTPYDDSGNPIAPDNQHPLYVNVFGAPDGALAQTSWTLTSGTSFQIAYTGQYMPDDLLLEAWMAIPGGGSPTAGEYSIGTTLIVRHNRQSPPGCSYQSASYSVGTNCTPGTLPGDCSNLTASNGIRVQAGIGASPSVFHGYTVDTGSLGVLVPQSDVPPATMTPGETQVVGPAGPGVKYYDSNGGATYHGQYWLAPVSFVLSDGKTVTTHPIKILVVPDTNPLHYLGIGFDRNSTEVGDYFDSPADNAFLNVNDLAHGSDLSQGYAITPTAITLGVTSSQGFETTPLTPNQCVPGDYAGAAGCFSFPTQSASFCGTMLMDTGIGDMYLNLHPGLRPPGLNQCDSGGNCVVPDNTPVQINSGQSMVMPPMCYRFNVGAPNPAPITPEPATVHWATSSDPTMEFVNTGRHPLAWFTYLYDASCGQIGFKPNSSYVATCD